VSAILEGAFMSRSGIRRALLLSLSVAAVTLAAGPSMAEDGDGRPPAAVTEAIIALGDLHATTGVAHDAAEKALRYYVERAEPVETGSIVGVIPPARLLEGEPSPGVPDADAAVKVFTVAAKMRDPNALLRLGDLYLSGQLVPADPEKAFDFFSQAADLGSQTASIQVALMMMQGLGTERDTKGGVDRLEALAATGSEQALVRLGDLYRQGEAGVIQPDAAKAFGYYKRAADGGSRTAALAMARLMLDGSGTPADPAGALAIAENLAASGYSEAYLFLGDIYLSGMPGVIDIDRTKAYEAYRVAGESGSVTAQIQSATMLARGDGVAQDVPAALSVLEENAARGDTRALLALAQLHETGAGEALPANADRAFGYYDTAAKRGSMTATLTVARMTLEGRGTKADPAAAVAMLEAAGARGESGALVLLGEYYAGLVVADGSRDLAKALAQYDRAAAMGSRTGTLRASMMKIRGEGTTKDVDGGIAMLRTLAESGEADAWLTLGDLYASGETGGVDAASAIAAYEAAGELGISDAFVKLGDIYSAGVIVPVDGERAIGFYAKAAGIDEIQPPEVQ
jgi:TPR repeat protein